MKLKQKTYNLLRWSQKYTKTDMVYLAKGGFWLSLGRIVSITMGLGLAMAFANLLPKEIYGQYKYIISLGSILMIPSLMGMNTAITQAVARGYERSVISGFKVRLHWGILSTIASLILSGYYYFNGNNTLTIAFLIIAPLIPIARSFGVFSSYFTGKKLFKKSSQYSITGQMISVSALIITLLVTDNIFLLLLVYYGSHAILNFFFFQIVLKKFSLNKKEDPKTIPYGKHLSLMSIIGTIAQHADKIIIWHFLGAANVAIYAFATLPVRQIVDSFKPLGSLAMAKFSNQNKEILKKTIPLKILKSLALTIPLTIAYIILAPTFFKFVFPQYLDAVFYSQIFALSIILQGSRVLGTYFNAQMRTKDLYVMNFINPTIKLALMLVMLPLWGIMGMVIALLIYQVFSAGLLMFMLKRS